MNPFAPRSFVLLVFAMASLLVNAQFLEGSPKGGGTFSDCDSSLVVDLIVQPLGDLEQLFTPVIEPGVATVINTTWTYYTDQVYQENGTSIQVTYPAPGETPVCLTVTAFDQGTASSTCSSTTCRFVNIVQDSLCLTYQPDFSIASVEGNSIGFEEIITGADSISLFWDFGSGITSLVNSPEATFPDPGPHEICLTVTGLFPPNCSATVCKWLYLGPDNVPCDQILAPGFMHFQSENFLVVLDTSVVTGQSSETFWDFGDGTTAEGAVAVHVYDPFLWGGYQVCSFVDVWGPLVNDTCQAQNCIYVEVGEVAIGIEEEVSSLLSIKPNPATNSIELAGLPEGSMELRIWDSTGRLVIDRDLSPFAGTIQLPIGDLAPGIHTLRLIGTDAVRTGRFMKE